MLSAQQGAVLCAQHLDAGLRAPYDGEGTLEVEPGSARARGRDATTGDQRVCHPEDPAAPELHRVRASCPARVPTRFVAAAADPPPPPASSRLMVAAGEPISALGICALLLERRGAPPAWAPRAQVSFCVQPTAGGRWKGSWYHGTKMNRMNSGAPAKKTKKGARSLRSCAAAGLPQRCPSAARAARRWRRRSSCAAGARQWPTAARSARCSPAPVQSARHARSAMHARPRLCALTRPLPPRPLPAPPPPPDRRMEGRAQARVRRAGAGVGGGADAARRAEGGRRARAGGADHAAGAPDGEVA